MSISSIVTVVFCLLSHCQSGSTQFLLGINFEGAQFPAANFPILFNNILLGNRPTITTTKIMTTMASALTATVDATTSTAMEATTMSAGTTGTTAAMTTCPPVSCQTPKIFDETTCSCECLSNSSQCSVATIFSTESCACTCAGNSTANQPSQLDVSQSCVKTADEIWFGAINDSAQYFVQQSQQCFSGPFRCNEPDFIFSIATCQCDCPPGFNTTSRPDVNASDFCTTPSGEIRYPLASTRRAFATSQGLCYSTNKTSCEPGKIFDSSNGTCQCVCEAGFQEATPSNVNFGVQCEFYANEIRFGFVNDVSKYFLKRGVCYSNGALECVDDSYFIISQCQCGYPLAQATSGCIPATLNATVSCNFGTEIRYASTASNAEYFPENPSSICLSDGPVQCEAGKFFDSANNVCSCSCGAGFTATEPDNADVNGACQKSATEQRVPNSDVSFTYWIKRGVCYSQEQICPGSSSFDASQCGCVCPAPYVPATDDVLPQYCDSAAFRLHPSRSLTSYYIEDQGCFMDEAFPCDPGKIFDVASNVCDCRCEDGYSETLPQGFTPSTPCFQSATETIFPYRSTTNVFVKQHGNCYSGFNFCSVGALFNISTCSCVMGACGTYHTGNLPPNIDLSRNCSKADGTVVFRSTNSQYIIYYQYGECLSAAFMECDFGTVLSLGEGVNCGRCGCVQGVDTAPPPQRGTYCHSLSEQLDKYSHTSYPNYFFIRYNGGCYSAATQCVFGKTFDTATCQCECSTPWLTDAPSTTVTNSSCWAGPDTVYYGDVALNTKYYIKFADCFNQVAGDCAQYAMTFDLGSCGCI